MDEFDTHYPEKVTADAIEKLHRSLDATEKMSFWTQLPPENSGAKPGPEFPDSASG